MTAVIFTVALIELIAYAVFLQRLANTVRRDKPAMAGALGAPEAWDYFVFGFGPGDRFISKLESRRSELLDEPRILNLMRIVRGVYVGFLLTMCAWVFVIVSHAN
jgi:hypothetical protein